MTNRRVLLTAVTLGAWVAGFFATDSASACNMEIMLKARLYHRVVPTGGGVPWTCKEVTKLSDGRIRIVTRKNQSVTLPPNKYEKIIRKASIREVYAEIAARINPGDSACRLRLAKACLQRQLTDEAIAELKKSTSANTSNIDVYDLLLTTLLDNNRTAEAARAWAGFSGQVKNNAKIKIYGPLLAETAGDGSEPIKEAMENATKLGTAAAWVAVGRLQARYHQPVEAVASFQKALELESNNKTAQTMLGHALMATGDYDSALSAYGKVLLSDRTNRDALIGKAAALLYLGNAAEAENILDRNVLIQHSRSGRAYALLGLALLLQDKLTDAEDKLQRATEYDSENARLHLIKGVLEEADTLDPDGALSAAITQYKRAASRAPGDSLVQAILGYALLRKGDLTGARSAYEKVLNASPGYLAGGMTLAHILMQQKKYKDAAARFALSVVQADVNMAMAEATRQPFFLAQKSAALTGMSLALLKQSPPAVGAAKLRLEEALETDPTNLDALCISAWIFIKEGDGKLSRDDPLMALDLLMLVLNIDPTHEWALKNIPAIHATLGETAILYTFPDMAHFQKTWRVGKNSRNVGLKASVAGGQLQLSGTLQQENGILEVFSMLAHTGPFKRFTATVSIDASTLGAGGLYVGVGNMRLYFGRGPSGKLASRIQDRSGLKDWLGDKTWPESGNVELTIEKPDAKRDLFVLLANGKKVYEAMLPNFSKAAGSYRVGFYATGQVGSGAQLTTAVASAVLEKPIQVKE